MPRAKSSPGRTRLHGRSAWRAAIPGGSRSRGVTLVIAMLMLLIIGVMSVAVMRNALGAGRVAAGNRLQIQASQLAQLALRRCEDELTPTSPNAAAGVVGLSFPPAWTRAAAWTGGALLAKTLAPADFSGTSVPRVFPQCLAEATGTPGSYVVTARGFSPDLVIDPQSGAVVAGAVVWLQSRVLVAPVATASGGSASCAAACPQAIVQRSWQQLLTPPF